MKNFIPVIMTVSLLMGILNSHGKNNGNLNHSSSSEAVEEFYCDAPDESFTDSGANVVFARTVNVSSVNQLKNAISNARAGDDIVVANGTYTTSGDIVISGKRGTSSNRIVIRAKSIGGVTIKGQGGFKINSNSEYITIQGFVFKHKGVRGQGHAGKHCLITRNVYECTDPGGTNSSSASYLKIYGPDNEISYNTFRNKNYRGPMLSVQGPNNKVAQNNWIHHNYFDDFPNKGTNDNAAIQPGYGALQESRALLTIEHNLFNKLKADAEGVMSIKCKNVTFRYNTIRDCNETVIRNGGESELYGNYYFGGSGIRFSDANNKIYNNVFVNTGTGVKIFRRKDSNPKWDDGYSHDPTNNAFVGFNTMIGCDRGIFHDGTGDSKNLKMVNNIFYNCGVAVDKDRENWTNPTISGNITWNSPKGDLPSSGVRNQNPSFRIDSNGVPHLKSNSPVRGDATGNYSFVSKDIDKDARNGAKDIGADQYSSAATKNKVLTTNDVGPNASSGGNGGGGNESPAVGFNLPNGDQNLPQDYDLVVRVNANDPDGKIANVKLFINGDLVRQENVAPYEWGHSGSPNPEEVNGLTTGTYVFRAVATDDEGATGEASITLTVNGGSGGGLEGTYTFKNVATGKYLDSNGTTIVTGSSNSGSDKRWRLVETTNGYYNIDSEDRGRGVLDTDRNKVVKGTTNQPVFRNDGSEWSVESLGGNTYRFKNRLAGRDYLAARTSDSGVEYTEWNGPRAQWTLQRVGGTNAKARLEVETEHDVSDEVFSLYPSPTTNELNLKNFASRDATIQVYDLSGNRVLAKTVESPTSEAQLDVGSLSNGVYIIEIITDGETVTKKFIKE